MAKLNSLTPEQEKALIAHRAYWLKAGLSTEPSDRATSERVITEFYNLRGLKAPYFWWCDGPMVAQLVINILRNEKFREHLGDNLGANLGDNLRDNLWVNLGDNLRDNLRDNLWVNLGDNLRANLGDNLGANLGDNLRDNLRDNLWANLGANLGDNLGDNLGANLWANLGANLGDNLGDNLRANLGDNLGANLGVNLRDNLRDNLWANLWANLGANLGDNLGANLGDNLRDNLWVNKLEFISTYFWGSLDSYWIAYYLYPEKYLSLKYDTDKSALLALWADLSRSAFWWWPFENIVVLSDRPLSLRRNAQGRLHCEYGPACEFRDSWALWYLDGQSIQEDVWTKIVSKQMTFAEIMATENADIRAVALKYNPEAIITSGSKLIDISKRGNALYLIKGSELNTFLDESEIWFLKMTCPTGRTFVEGVDPKFARQHPKADLCQAKALGLTPAQYCNLTVEG